MWACQCEPVLSLTPLAPIPPAALLCNRASIFHSASRKAASPPNVCSIHHHHHHPIPPHPSCPPNQGPLFMCQPRQSSTSLSSLWPYYLHLLKTIRFATRGRKGKQRRRIMWCFMTHTHRHTCVCTIKSSSFYTCLAVVYVKVSLLERRCPSAEECSNINTKVLFSPTDLILMWKIFIQSCFNGIVLTCIDSVLHNKENRLWFALCAVTAMSHTTQLGTRLHTEPASVEFAATLLWLGWSQKEMRYADCQYAVRQTTWFWRSPKPSNWYWTTGGSGNVFRLSNWCSSVRKPLLVSQPCC